MNSIRLAFRALCMAILVLAMVEIFWTHSARSFEGSEQVPVAVTEKQPESHENAEAKEEEDSTQEDIARDLEQKRVALEERQRVLEDQDNRLKEREKDLDKKIKEMERLRSAIAGELDAQKKTNEERVVKMVAVFETMSPKSASGVLETLDDWLAVEVLKRMDVKRVAKVMNIMDKTRSARLSEMLTGFYNPQSDRKISSVTAGQAAVPSASKADVGANKNPKKKGGE